MTRFMLTFLMLLCLATASQAMAASVTEEQREQLRALGIEGEITPEMIEAMEEVVFSSERSVEERLRAIGQLSGLGDLPESERMSSTFCIWDIAGRSGPVYQAARDEHSRAQEFGLDVQLEVYTNENVMVEELLAGKCDAALMSGLRAREFNSWTGTIDAIGAVPDQDHMRTLLQVATHPSNAPQMREGNYVVLGVFPGGAAHVFVNDREINSLAHAAGKRVAVLEHDPMQARMIAGIGATPVPTDIAHAPGKFNDGVVDVLAAPLMAYEIMELYRGMEPDGGIIDYPLTQLTMQLIGRRDRFPQEVAQIFREATFERFDDIMEFINREAERVPEHWMVDIPEEDRQEYEVMMQEARVTLREMDYYDEDMLNLQRRIRCRYDPERYECSDPQE